MLGRPGGQDAVGKPADSAAWYAQRYWSHRIGHPDSGDHQSHRNGVHQAAVSASDHLPRSAASGSG